MINIYEYLDYRNLIKDCLDDFKKRRPGWTMHKVAVKAGMQPPYLTNVLKERSHFSSDQLYAVAELIGLSQQEADYTHLLLEWERSGLSTRKERLKKQIDEIRSEQQKVEAHVDKEVLNPASDEVTRYFLHPELRLISVFLSIPRFSKHPGLIAECLNISIEKLNHFLQELVEIKFIKKTNEGYKLLRDHIHLPKGSHLSQPHTVLMQYRSLQHQQLLDEKERQNFSLVFSSDDKTREKIHSEFLKFLSSIEPLVRESKEEDVFHLHFDLFKWSVEGRSKPNF